MARPTRKTEDTTLGPVLAFMRVLWSLSHELDALSKRMDATYGVTGPQRLVLRIAGQQPGIGAGRLAEILRVHPSTLTGIFKRLVERGLLERRLDPTDGRRALFELTPRGRAIDALREGTVEAAIQRALQRAARDHLAATTAVLEDLTTTLRREGRGPKR